MNIFKPLHDMICQSVCHVFSIPILDIFSKITLEPTRNPIHGDLATNGAMVLAKHLQKTPREVATLLCDHLQVQNHVAKAEVAGPGFINLTLTPQFWRTHLVEILTEGRSYGSSTLGQNIPVNVEFVSVNPTGPLHAGHGRNAVFGDAIAALLTKVGYAVTREYYINDAGGQVNALADSVYLRYKEALGQSVQPEDFTSDMYGGHYLVPIGQHLAQLEGVRWLEVDRSHWLPFFRKYAVDAMMKDIQEDLALLGIHMDVYTSEEKLVQEGAVDRALQILEDEGHVYVGVLTQPKGHTVEDWEERPQTLFRSTTYGDTLDRALKKSDGTWTYFAGDIAYHLNKLQRGFTHMVNILSADHAGYIKRIHAAVRALTQDTAHIDIKVYQMVNFLDQGQPVRMSKRAGTFITLRDVIDRVGKDATRFMMISRHADMPIDFDFAKVLEQSRDNPIFYIQYAHARICSVLRHAQSLFPHMDLEKLKDANLERLTEDAEFAMIKIISEWPKQVETAALCREPHRIATYLYDVASEFHALWNKGKEKTQLRFIHVEDEAETCAKLALILAVQNVIASGLLVFGITPTQEMR